MPSIRVQNEAFNTGEEVQVFCNGNSGSGGVAIFVGQMRDFSGPDRSSGTVVEAMTLEHYSGMAERQLSSITAEAHDRWPVDDILIVHRYGDLKPGDPIVLVAVASAHREPAFDACRFLMDWLKTQAPFWKKETSAGGATWVKASAGDDAKAKRWKPQ
jgi:molybdopterin synthase catalytic subunit